MEIIYATVIGAAIGAIPRYVIPGRMTYGTTITPIIGGVATALVWVILTWLGMPYDGGWIWVIALAAAAVASVLVAFLLPKARHRSDEAFLESARRAA